MTTTKDRQIKILREAFEKINYEPMSREQCEILADEALAEADNCKPDCKPKTCGNCKHYMQSKLNGRLFCSEQIIYRAKETDSCSRWEGKE